MKEKTEYDIQAETFLSETGIELNVEWLTYGKHFADDTDTRDVYQCTLKRGSREYSFRFGQSINNSFVQTGNFDFPHAIPPLNPNCILYSEYKERWLTRMKDSSCGRAMTKERRGKILGQKEADYTPTAYDILVCLQKYDPGSFENFCSEFGSDPDSKKAEKTYQAVRDEWLHVQSLWNDAELEKLQEIN